jgi:hypothetical protein
VAKLNFSEQGRFKFLDTWQPCPEIKFFGEYSGISQKVAKKAQKRPKNTIRTYPPKNSIK